MTSFELTCVYSLPQGFSAIEFIQGHLWAIADDIHGIYRWSVSEQVFKAFTSFEQAAGFQAQHKSQKWDLEASALVGNTLFCFGSGSHKSQRSLLISFEIETHTFASQSLQKLYEQLQSQGLAPNIEGATYWQNSWLLANRGHQNHTVNYVVQTDLNVPLAIQKWSLPPTAQFVGISSLFYDQSTQRLWFTASTESTGNPYDDGEIGDSYLGWIEHYSPEQTEVSPSCWLNLSHIDTRFRGHKIEGLAFNQDHVYLISDNDGTPAALFVLQIQKD